MNFPYRLADNAARDLREIWKYVALREKNGPQLRYFPVGNYVIYYRPLTDEPAIEIVRILHGHRNADSIFGTQQGD